MGNAAGELAERFHLLGVEQLLLQVLALPLRLLALGDVDKGHDRTDELAFLFHGMRPQLGGKPGAVAPPQGLLLAMQQSPAAGRALDAAGFLRAGRAVGVGVMHELVHVRADDVEVAKPQHPPRRRVHEGAGSGKVDAVHAFGRRAEQQAHAFLAEPQGIGHGVDLAGRHAGRDPGKGDSDQQRAAAEQHDGPDLGEGFGIDPAPGEADVEDRLALGQGGGDVVEGFAVTRLPRSQRNAVLIAANLEKRPRNTVAERVDIRPARLLDEGVGDRFLLVVEPRQQSLQGDPVVP